MKIERIRMMAKAERMMDAGLVPWVWAIGPDGRKERLSVAPEVMEILELEQEQSVNSFIVNAIAELSFDLLRKEIEQITQESEDAQLTDDFDFRKEMDK